MKIWTAERSTLACVLAAIAWSSGCFADPPGADAEEPSTETSTSTATATTTATTGATESPASSSTATTDTTVGSVGSAGSMVTTLPPTTTAATTLETGLTFGSSDTGLVPNGFCSTKEFIACESFEPPSTGFGPLLPSPANIAVDLIDDPAAALSPPISAALAFSYMGGEPTFAQSRAMFQLPPAPNPTLRFELGVRFGDDYDQACGGTPTRLFEIVHGEIGPGTYDQLEFRLSPTRLDVFQYGTDADMLQDVVRDHVHSNVATTDWIEVEVTLAPGPLTAAITVNADGGPAFEGAPIWHEGASDDLEFNFGFFTNSGNTVEYDNCRYWVDNVGVTIE